MWQNILKIGIHKHTFTCKKPPSGKHKCRGGYPVASNAKTRPILLAINENHSELPLVDIIPEEAKNQKIEPPLDPKKRTCNIYPMPPLEEKLIVWEFKRSNIFF